MTCLATAGALEAELVEVETERLNLQHRFRALSAEVMCELGSDARATSVEKVEAASVKEKDSNAMPVQESKEENSLPVQESKEENSLPVQESEENAMIVQESNENAQSVQETDANSVPVKQAGETTLIVKEAETTSDKKADAKVISVKNDPVAAKHVKDLNAHITEVETAEAKAICCEVTTMIGEELTTEAAAVVGVKVTYAEAMDVVKTSASAQADTTRVCVSPSSEGAVSATNAQQEGAIDATGARYAAFGEANMTDAEEVMTVSAEDAKKIGAVPEKPDIVVPVANKVDTEVVAADAMAVKEVGRLGTTVATIDAEKTEAKDVLEGILIGAVGTEATHAVVACAELC